MKKRWTWIKYTVLAAAFLGAVGYLFVSGMRGSMVYYLTLEELAVSPPGPGKGIRLAGWVKEGSLSAPSSDGQVSFTITDGERELQVRFQGQVPDTFNESAEVIVEGVYRDAPVFDASTLLAKCPSKYERSGPYGSTRADQ